MALPDQALAYELQRNRGSCGVRNPPDNDDRVWRPDQLRRNHARPQRALADEHRESQTTWTAAGALSFLHSDKLLYLMDARSRSVAGGQRKGPLPVHWSRAIRNDHFAL